MAGVSPSRLAALTRLRCSVFATAYNPTSQHTGAKYLRARLRGPSMMKYYPQVFKISDINKRFPELELVDEDEAQRFADIEALKARGKGAPKKARSKGLHEVKFSVSCVADNLRNRGKSKIGEEEMMCIMCFRGFCSSRRPFPPLRLVIDFLHALRMLDKRWMGLEYTRSPMLSSIWTGFPLSLPLPRQQKHPLFLQLS